MSLREPSFLLPSTTSATCVLVLPVLLVLLIPLVLPVLLVLLVLLVLPVLLVHAYYDSRCHRADFVAGSAIGQLASSRVRCPIWVNDEQCERTFRGNQGLFTHMRTEHAMRNIASCAVTTDTCTFCHNAYRRVRDAKRHVARSYLHQKCRLDNTVFSMS